NRATPADGEVVPAAICSSKACSASSFTSAFYRSSSHGGAGEAGKLLKMPSKLTLTLAITGASGAALARAALARLHADEQVERVDLVASPHGLRVVREELQLGEGRLDQLA